MATANQKHAIVLIEKYTGIKYKGEVIRRKEGKKASK